jgi:peptidyl-tRNA hydrolase
MEDILLIHKINTAQELTDLMTSHDTWLADMPFELYRSIDAAHFSALKGIMKSPRHYQWSKSNQQVTDAMIFGSAFHLMMESEALFKEQVVCKPKFDLRKKEDKQLAQEWNEANQSKLIIDTEEMELIYEIKKICDSKQKLANIRRNGRTEISGYYTHPEIAVPCKFRVDLAREEGLIVDYKTTMDASEEGFKWSARKFSYHVQAAFYLDGMSFCSGKPFNNYLIVPIEKNRPCDLNIFHLDSADIDLGREAYLKALQKYKECREANSWPGYTDEIKKLKLFYQKG